MKKEKCGYLNKDNTCNCTLRCMVEIKPSKHQLETKIIGKKCPAYLDNYHTVFNKALRDINNAMNILKKLEEENV